MNTVLNLSAQDLNHALVDDIKEQFGHANVEIRVYDVPDGAGILKEEDFWSLIDQLDWSKSENDAILSPLVELLSTMHVANIYQFQDILSEKLWLLDTRAHSLVFTDEVEQDYFSPDDFLYARCGVVANGKDFFTQILENPNAMPVDATFSPLLRVAKMAYLRKTGKKMTIVPSYNFETFSNLEGWQ